MNKTATTTIRKDSNHMHTDETDEFIVDWLGLLQKSYNDNDFHENIRLIGTVARTIDSIWIR